MFYFIWRFAVLFTIITTYSQSVEDYDRVITIFSQESSKSFSEQNYQDLDSLIQEVNQNWTNRLTYLKEKNSIWRTKLQLSPEDHKYTDLGLESCEKLQDYWGNFVESFKRFKKVRNSFERVYTCIQDCLKEKEFIKWGIIQEEIPFYLVLKDSVSVTMHTHMKTLAESLLRKIKELQSQTTHLAYPTTGYLWTAWNSSIRKVCRAWNDGVVFDSSPDFLIQIPIMEQLAKEKITPFYWDFLKCFPHHPSPDRKHILLDTLPQLVTAFKLDLEQIKSQLDQTTKETKDNVQ